MEKEMTAAKHTPGPWTLTIEPSGVKGVEVRYYVNSSSRHGICFGQSQEHLGESVGIQKIECEANARLIAAAPDLLEALTMVRDADEDCWIDGLLTIPPSARAKIDAAIAKAAGQEGGAA